ncbi:putative disease resistance protein RGA1 [Sesamum angolense]|uniref:Disease resistance protein RGA1 n=1 Tax=Sesamum angolense TaxID=2727404 RepID=A0AAE1X5C9_9LAMI|nr:putative disease resistance protein RGA1 [Sesamum angolense]
MADAGVSMVLNRLAPLIEKRVREEVSLLLNADKEAQSLSLKLKKIHEVLEDAERKGEVDPRVKSWLDKLQDIAYDIDDAVDEWELENIRQQLQDDGIDSWEKKVSAFLQSVCLCFKQTLERRAIALRIKGINKRLDSVAQENENEFKFIPNLGRASDEDFKRTITTSYVDVSEIHGRDHDKETLVSELLSESSSRDGVQTISVVGSGGMGKSSLAQLVCADISVKNQFKPRMWACVSDPFDEIKIAKAILEVADRSSSSLTQPQALLQSIERLISGQKFLLVLDDAWEKDESKWRPLRACLKNGAPGSRILVTTRNRKVAEAVGSTYMHSLEPLSDSYCWSILSQIAFKGKGEVERELLKETGLEIAKKCKGLPLAARIVGGLLHSKDSPQEWEDVLESEMWEEVMRKEYLFPLLRLSYNELSPAGNTGCILPEYSPSHHIGPKDDTNLGPFRIWEAEQLRSCFCNENGIPQNLFSCLKQVRLLSLRDCNLTEIPKEIGNLIHIRYLDISYNYDMKDLPESIYDLYYLETLDIECCISLSGLPDHGIHKLINLRHLLNFGSTSFDFGFPQGLEKLTNLRTLNEFNASGINMGCLKGLNRLGGTLRIKLWGEIIDEVEAKKADLESKKRIQTLILNVEGAARTQIVEALRPHRNLQILQRLHSRYNPETGQDWTLLSHIHRVDFVEDSEKEDHDY